ncbi:General stress protein 16O [Methylacidimicrobium cyclopophantes]|uniref:General stress protein 16O n=1 Tax=Methylacidimicrobium cyclopophantes TaxID=1041766 RepID=A0A5E6MF27_9BACT|nr:TraR/DksA C4-type zinc finger protein [Methylacidimicrobium cyclopophantes]VVM06851.1 General stress protein 16O [Methylacidimicrobium cyclopophantes]
MRPVERAGAKGSASWKKSLAKPELLRILSRAMAGKNGKKTTKGSPKKVEQETTAAPAETSATKKVSRKASGSTGELRESKVEEGAEAAATTKEEVSQSATLTLADLPPKRRQAFLEKQKRRLKELRDDILGQMQGIAQDSLRVRPEGSEATGFGMHQADAGTDAYDKDFALTLLSQEQDALYEIEEALKRIEAGTYGVCEMSGKPIPLQRLEAVPHARFTVECQRQVELQSRFERRWESVPQFGEAAEAAGEEEEESGEERESPAD